MDLALGVEPGGVTTLSPWERKAFAVVFGELEGGTWNWFTDSWEKSDDA